MSVAERSYLGEYPIAAEAGVEVRADFIKKTYTHLAGAILAFVGLEGILLNLPNIESFIGVLLAFGWWVPLIGFMVVSWIAERWAHSATSVRKQYLGLGIFIVAEVVIFLPLLWVARGMGDEIIPTAATITVFTFAGLTAIVWVTRKDFSFLRPLLWLGAWVALGLILCGMLFGFTLGTGFVVAMIALASGYILYHTSQVLHSYRVGQHVAASLALFASVALLFWYVIQLVMDRE